MPFFLYRLFNVQCVPFFIQVVTHILIFIVAKTDRSILRGADKKFGVARVNHNFIKRPGHSAIFPVDAFIPPPFFLLLRRLRLVGLLFLLRIGVFLQYFLRQMLHIPKIRHSGCFACAVFYAIFDYFTIKI